LLAYDAAGLSVAAGAAQLGVSVVLCEARKMVPFLLPCAAFAITPHYW
jgi:2-polyprenyl-6-methoxyphenol hydroxylase-like FAD-dependent oxidoreductase